MGWLVRNQWTTVAVQMAQSPSAAITITTQRNDLKRFHAPSMGGGPKWTLKKCRGRLLKKPLSGLDSPARSLNDDGNRERSHAATDHQELGAVRLPEGAEVHLLWCPSCGRRHAVSGAGSLDEWQCTKCSQKLTVINRDLSRLTVTGNVLPWWDTPASPMAAGTRRAQEAQLRVGHGYPASSVPPDRASLGCLAWAVCGGLETVVRPDAGGGGAESWSWSSCCCCSPRSTRMRPGCCGLRACPSFRAASVGGPTSLGNQLVNEIEHVYYSWNAPRRAGHS